MATPNEPKKDTIYIDVDDEITAIIEKLRASQHRIVALVLPKRATVLQSVVNMKLLKRTADNAKKHVVLITSEPGLLPLAGAVGMFVANSLNSKPSIPSGPGSGYPEDDTIGSQNVTEAADLSDDFDAQAAASRPLSTLAGSFNEPETIELDNADATALGTGSAAAAGVTAANAKPKKGKDKSLKVPNFNKFRVILIASIALLVLLIGGMVWANAVLPEAEISLQTDSTDIQTKEILILDPTAKEFDPASNVMPSKIASKQQTGSQQVSTSGQKNNGIKASGEITVTNCGPSDTSIAAGRGFSANGKTYISQKPVTIPTSDFTFGGATCKNNGKATVDVVATIGGADYNIQSATYTIAKDNSSQDTTYLTAKGSEMTSGTDNIVKIVAQADIDGAKSKITGGDDSAVKSDLEKILKNDGYTAVSASLHAAEPSVTPSANVGDQADTVTVTQTTAYTMYGLKQADVRKVITASVNKEIDTTKQQIINDGAGRAKYQITSTTASGPLQASLTATSLAGPDINPSELKKQFAGKKTGDIKTITSTIPGVSDVTVKYSPFWVKTVPKKTDKITIVIVKADGATTSTQASDNEYQSSQSQGTMQRNINPNKAALALDVGEKRIGVAVANLGVRFAGPLTTLENPKSFLSDIDKLCRQEDAGLIVIGLPRGLDGQDTAQTGRIRMFGEQLGEYLGKAGHRLPLYWIDEALTSRKAEDELSQRAGKHRQYHKLDVDALAATYILEDFLKEFHG